MKNTKRILSLALAIVMMVGLIGFAAPNKANAEWFNNWTYGQNKAHEYADGVRELGGKISAFLAAASAYWFSQSGRNIDNDFYYDATNNLSTYADGRTTKGIGGYSNQSAVFYTDQNIRLNSGNGYLTSDGKFVYNNGLSYTDGYYTYQWSSSKNQYYRFLNENGTKTYDGPRTRYAATYNGTSGGTNTSTGNTGYSYSIAGAYTERSSNLPGYDYTFHGVKLYAGRIYGLDGYVAKADAEQFAKILLSLDPNGDIKSWSATGWLIANIKNGRTWSEVIACFQQDYNANVSLSAGRGPDAVTFSREMLFRTEAEQNGIGAVGRTLPKTVGYYRRSASAVMSFYENLNESTPAYTFPEYNSSFVSALHTPY